MNTDTRIIPVVNMQDEIIWHKTREEITPDDIYRVAACWITDSEWNILLQQRPFTKKHSPWMRQCAACWTIEWEESYFENIIHEIEEETWIVPDISKIQAWEKRFSHTNRKKFCMWYSYVYDWDKSLIQPEEWWVEQLKWRTPQEFKEYFTAHPEKGTGGMKYCIETFL